MKVTIKKIIVLELNITEATWLKDVMQNPLNNVLQDQEKKSEKEIREKFFENLNIELES